MNTRFVFAATLSLAASSLPVVQAAQPPLSQTTARPAPETVTDNQQVYGPTNATLVSPEKARQVVDAFSVAYEKSGKPRLLFYVNRELVDETSGLKTTGRTERTETVQTENKNAFEADPNAPKPAEQTAPSPQTQVNVALGDTNNGTAAGPAPGKGSSETKGQKVTSESKYVYTDKTNASVADRQTVREVERLFGRPFRAAGATLADQKTASALIADRPLDHFTAATSEGARKDREALARIADVAIEVLVSSRTITVPGISSDQTTTVPDIQVTAIRLSDSAIIGQASSSDVLGKNQQAIRVARSFDIRDITEATALALMEDMTSTAR